MTSWGLTNELLQTTNLALLAVVGYFLRGLVAEIKELKKNQHLCQLSLVGTYRTKAEAETDSSRQWEKLDEHGEAIASCNQRHVSHEKRLDRLEMNQR